MSFNVFDIVFVALLVIFVVLSFMRGFARELFILLGLLGGFLAAERLAGVLAARIEPLLPDPEAAELLAFVGIMLIGYFLGVFLGGMSDYLRDKPVGEASRMLGALMGLGKGLVVCLALYWVVAHHVPAFQDELAESWMGAWLGRVLDFLEGTGLV